MKVKCLFNNAIDERLPKAIIEHYVKNNEDPNFDLIVGKEYTVYALTVNFNYPWYYIYDEWDRGYPLWHPAPLFEVTDNRLSRYWLFSVLFDQERRCDTLLAYPEWAKDPYNYYSALVDGEKWAEEIFQRYKQLMDNEFERQDSQL